MLHQPTAHFDPGAPASAPLTTAKGYPVFDPAAYVDALRALGAELRPVRRKPGTNLAGTYTLEPPSDPAARRRVEVIEGAFAAQRAADRFAAGRIAEHLFLEVATRLFAAVVGDDWAVALGELARLKDALGGASDRADDDPEVAHAGTIASEAYMAACDYALALPLRSAEDLGRKAEFALRHVYCGGDLQKVLADIAGFGRPEFAGCRPETLWGA